LVCLFKNPPRCVFKVLSILIKPLFSGDEIFSVNGRTVAGLTHQEAIAIFKEVKLGPVQVAIGRREARHPVLSICE
jgi:hypothetical protein